MSTRAGLLDTSVLIAREHGRPLDAGALPEPSAISVATVSELHAGVLAARGTATRSRRLSTLDAISALEALPITAEVGRRWAELRVRLAEQGRRAKADDLRIAAVALADDLDVVTQDDDLDVIEDAGGPHVLRA